MTAGRRLGRGLGSFLHRSSGGAGADAGVYDVTATRNVPSILKMSMEVAPAPPRRVPSVRPTPSAPAAPPREPPHLPFDPPLRQATVQIDDPEIVFDPIVETVPEPPEPVRERAPERAARSAPQPAPQREPEPDVVETVFVDDILFEISVAPEPMPAPAPAAQAPPAAPTPRPAPVAPAPPKAAPPPAPKPSEGLFDDDVIVGLFLPDVDLE